MNAPSIRSIVSHWTDNLLREEFAVALDDAHKRCWRCGYKTALQRCHIVPKSIGGSGDPSNFILLCGRCHREAPNHSNPKYMFDWIRGTMNCCYDAYWTDRGFQEFETIYKRRPFSKEFFSSLTSQLPPNAEIDALREEMKKVEVHYGEGRLSPATIAAVIAEVEANLKRKFG